MNPKIVLTIGGSDSGGGAGIQADLKTFMALKLHGCSAITCVTAQNSLGVIDLQAIELNTIKNQIKALFSDFEFKALKTGMLLNEDIIKSVGLQIKEFTLPKIIDPVMVSRSGAKLLEDNAVEAYINFLFPQADIVTPNIFEANLLTGQKIASEKDVEKAGENILGLGTNAVLIKGGGLNELKGKDFYTDKKGIKYWLEDKKVNTSNTHGSGCTLSAAICSFRALENPLFNAIKDAKIFTQKAIINSYQIGSGPGPLGHSA